MSHRFLVFLTLAAVQAQTPAGGPRSAPQFLSLCSKCVDLRVSSLTGAGTTNAVAEARITREDAKGWCENWQPGSNLAACIRDQMADNKLYRASADCRAGRITSVMGETYAIAGVWTNDVGRGRTKWRNAAGQIVGQDNASGGLDIAQQWEVLCPGPLRIAAQRPPAPAPSSSVCAGRPGCAEVGSFAASIVDFRATVQGRDRLVTATVRFQNKTAQPLILGFVADGGVALDDQGNRYLIAGEAAVRGIGLIVRNSVDPKFVLQPGEASDGRFELVWRPSGREIFGTSYTLDLTIREIVPLPANQFRLGREHAIRFNGLGGAAPHPAPHAAPQPAVTSMNAPAPTAPPAAAAPAPSVETAAAPPPPLPDACGGRPRCYSAGPFAVEVLQVTGSQAAPGGHHVVRFNMRFRNVTNQPIVLAYKATTSKAVDNNGNPYFWGRSGTYDTSFQGIGVIQGSKVDPSFVLRPGETRTATFGVVRFSPPRNAILGSAFTYDLVIGQIELMTNGQQVRVAREYSINFQNLQAGNAQAAAPAANVNEAVKRLGDVFRRKK
jgi:hypothetical protein